MNERSPLLHPDANAPAVIVHNVQHDATSQMGTCCMGDGVRTDTLCKICNSWICKSHSGTHQSNDKIVVTEFDPPLCFLSETFMRQHNVHPVCPDCQMYEERPVGSQKKFINTNGKVMLCFCAIIFVVITVAVLAN